MENEHYPCVTRMSTVMQLLRFALAYTNTRAHAQANIKLETKLKTNDN